MQFGKAQKIVENCICRIMSCEKLDAEDRKEGLFDLPKVKELKQILKIFDDKIVDTTIALKQKPEF